MEAGYTGKDDSENLTLSNSSTDNIITTVKDDKESSDNSEETCPLFMDGLPSDFHKNPALAAIASFLDDDQDEDEKVKKSRLHVAKRTMDMPRLGGGKVQRNRSRKHSLENSPYQKTEEKKRTATLGEAQLFLNMWKL